MSNDENKLMVCSRFKIKNLIQQYIFPQSIRGIFNLKNLQTENDIYNFIECYSLNLIVGIQILGKRFHNTLKLDEMLLIWRLV